MFTPFLLTTASNAPNQPESMVYTFDDRTAASKALHLKQGAQGFLRAAVSWRIEFWKILGKLGLQKRISYI